jgi:hypothetical protein
MENYFVLERENIDNYPLLVFDNGDEDRLFKIGKPISVPSPVQLSIGKPKPKKPVLVDYHKTPIPVFSPRIADVLVPMHISEIQLIPAELNTGGAKHPYHVLHIMNKIACIDFDASELKWISPKFIGEILKLVLDIKTLNEIPLEKRMIFKIEGYSSAYLFEESVKNAIMSVNPVGLRFFHTDEWNSLVCFK